MKNIYSIILLGAVLLLWMGCSDDAWEDVVDKKQGYFSISSLSLGCDEDVQPLVRAVDETLQVDLYQGDRLVKSFPPGSDLSQRIMLPVGEYLLKVFTSDQDEAASETLGYPVYEYTSSFIIREKELTSVSALVPQKNIGISVEVSDEFLNHFYDWTVEVRSISGRVFTFSQHDLSSNLCYFAMPSDGQLQYSISAKNADEELMVLTRTIEGINVARNYRIRLNIGGVGTDFR